MNPNTTPATPFLTLGELLDEISLRTSSSSGMTGQLRDRMGELGLTLRQQDTLHQILTGHAVQREAWGH